MLLSPFPLLPVCFGFSFRGGARPQDRGAAACARCGVVAGRGDLDGSRSAPPPGRVVGATAAALFFSVGDRAWKREGIGEEMGRDWVR
jgi:hypothetical protein